MDNLGRMSALAVGLGIGETPLTIWNAASASAFAFSTIKVSELTPTSLPKVCDPKRTEFLKSPSVLNSFPL